jgi:hypothetical protein
MIFKEGSYLLPYNQLYNIIIALNATVVQWDVRVRLMQPSHLSSLVPTPSKSWIAQYMQCTFLCQQVSDMAWWWPAIIIMWVATIKWQTF